VKMDVDAEEEGKCLFLCSICSLVILSFASVRSYPISGGGQMKAQGRRNKNHSRDVTRMLKMADSWRKC